MTLATVIKPTDFNTLINSAFKAESPVVTSAESDLGQPLEKFASAAEVKAKVAQCMADGVSNYSFGLWYPSMKGSVSERKVSIDPPRDGHSFRYSLSGWGLIRIQIYVTQPDTLQCRVTVNSQAKSQKREQKYPEQGAVADWDWQQVQTYAFRLTRQLAAMGPTAPVVQ